MALGDQHHVAIGNSHRLVQLAVLGENALEPETLFRVQAVVVGLFQIGHVRKIVFVVPMRRVG